MVRPGPALLLSALSSRPTVVVAISGGSDSTALLLMAIEATAATRIVAATVDHGLRAESAAEAAGVAALCASLGVEHRTLAWRGDKPASGISQAAREARHRLLSQLAVELGTDIVLTGHTLDDQAETVAMRARRGTGLGLAGMAPATLFEGRTWFVRPLLDRRRKELRAFLSGRGLGWIDDPTNADPRFERARLRAAMSEPDILVSRANATASSRRQAMGHAADLIAQHATMASPGLARLESALLSQEPTAALLAMRLVLATIGGTDHLPRESAVDALLKGLPDAPASLGRCLIERRAGAIYIWREPRGFRAASVTRQPAIWDGRWEISATEERGLTVNSAPPATEIEDGDLPRRPLRGATLAEPVLWHDAHPLGPLRTLAPSCGVVATPVVAPYARFLPAFDLPAARALAGLVGAARPPHLPWEGQIDAER